MSRSWTTATKEEAGLAKPSYNRYALPVLYVSTPLGLFKVQDLFMDF